MIANLAGGDLALWVIIALIVLVGGSQLPKIARNVGLAGKEFKQAQREAEREAEKEKAEAAKKNAEMPPPQQLDAPAAASSSANGDGSISMTAAQLDALLKAREEQVRNEKSTDAHTN